MPFYAIAQGRIEDRAKLDQYVKGVIPLIAEYGGRVLGFDETPEVIEGEVEFPRTVILEFDSKEAFRTWYDSDAYQAILPLRTESTPGTLIAVRGLAQG